MGMFTKTAEPVALVKPVPLALIASAVRMTLSDEAWRGYRFTDEGWQRLAWEFYDTNSQLHNAVDYVGNACSLVRIYVANVDENGVRQDEVEDDSEIAALADNLFGGPAAKAEILRTLAESLTVAGECYLIGMSSRPAYGDKWMVLAPSEVRRQGKVVWINVGHAVREQLNPSRDIIVRVHTPHPRRPLLADSPVRALLDTLHRMREIQLFKRSQFNSRIANAVVLPVPETLAIPKGDDEASSVDDVYQQLFEVMTSNLEGKGTAAQIAPILWPMPLAELEAMKGMAPIRFESVLSEVLAGMEKQEMEKLAIGINVPVEIQLGGREMNHWGVWFAGEEFIVKSIMPLMGRIVDALTEAYLYPALKFLKKDPARYTYWYDVAPLSSSANQTIDAINLFEKNVIGEDALRRVANFNDADAPTEKELASKFIKELLLRDPTLFTVEQVREAIGIFIETALPQLSTPPPPPPAPQELPQGPAAGQKPDMRETEGLTDNDSDLIASSAPSPIFVACNNAVIRALELTNKRLLSPQRKSQFPNADLLTLHTKVIISSADQVERNMEGAWKYLPMQLDGLGGDSYRL